MQGHTVLPSPSCTYLGHVWQNLVKRIVLWWQEHLAYYAQFLWAIFWEHFALRQHLLMNSNESDFYFSGWKCGLAMWLRWMSMRAECNCAVTLLTVFCGPKLFMSSCESRFEPWTSRIWSGMLTTRPYVWYYNVECGIPLLHAAMLLQKDFSVCREEMVYRKPSNYRDLVQKTIIGVTVLTRYNNRVYRIDDIDWNQSPSSTFSTHIGETVSTVMYSETSIHRYPNCRFSGCVVRFVQFLISPI